MSIPSYCARNPSNDRARWYLRAVSQDFFRHGLEFWVSSVLRQLIRNQRVRIRPDLFVVLFVICCVMPSRPSATKARKASGVIEGW